MPFTDFQIWSIAGISSAIIVSLGGAIYSAYRITYCKGKNDTVAENKISLLQSKVQDITVALSELSETVQNNKEKIASMKGTLEATRENIDTLLKIVTEK